MYVGAKVRRDEGFSIAEVVIAASILFFVLTAVIGLIGASQTMGVTAKNRLTLTNAMAEHIDHIRAMDYYTIATPPTGAVPTSEEATYGAYTITFTNRVIMPDGANGEYLRTVYTNAVATMNGRTYRTSAVVHIRNPRNDTTAASISDPDAPALSFTDDSAAENAVLYGKQVYPDGSSIHLEVDAHSDTDQVTQLKFLVGNVLVRDDAGALGDDAAFEFLPGLADASAQTGWDTLQDGVSEGLQKVVVQARDSMGRFTMIERQFIVDNEAPGTPGTPSVRNQTSTLTRYHFKASPDPIPADGQQASGYAPSYWIRIRRSPSTGGALFDWPIAHEETVMGGANAIDAMFNPGPIREEFETVPFSRYWVRIRGVSARGLISAGRSSAYFISPPEVVSTTGASSTCQSDYVKSGKTSTTTYTLQVYLTKPTFPVDIAATTVKVHSKQDGSSSGWITHAPTSATVTDVGSYWRVDCVIKDSAQAKNLWFKIGLDVTPSGESAAGFVTSNACGVSAIDSDGKSGTPVTATLVPDTTWTR